MRDERTLPTVSLCTPTADRLAFLPLLAECIRRQSYPKERLEWLVLDDGASSARETIASCQHGIGEVRYFRDDARLPIGRKRNLLNERSSGQILVYLDDDDYYPPERVVHAVDSLLAHPECAVAGSSCLHIWLVDTDEVWRLGPFGANHASAATFAFRRELLATTAFDDHARLAEERTFLKDFTLPIFQLTPEKTICSLSHYANTVDKRPILDKGPSSSVWRLSTRPEDYVQDDELRTGYERAAIACARDGVTR